MRGASSSGIRCVRGRQRSSLLLSAAHRTPAAAVPQSRPLRARERGLPAGVVSASGARSARASETKRPTSLFFAALGEAGLLRLGPAVAVQRLLARPEPRAPLRLLARLLHGHKPLAPHGAGPGHRELFARERLALCDATEGALQHYPCTQIRGPYAYLGSGWSGCGITSFDYPAGLALDYGEPQGLCAETASGSGVFVREWTKSTVQMDCNTWTPTITFK